VIGINFYTFCFLCIKPTPLSNFIIRFSLNLCLVFLVFPHKLTNLFTNLQILAKMYYLEFVNLYLICRFVGDKYEILAAE